METFTLMLGGDLMCGRGIDQVQRHPGEPTLQEDAVRDARDYVRLAEHRHGRIPAPVEPAWIWGEALAEIERRAPTLRLVNLETAITDCGQPWPAKAIHYRMHPGNCSCLRAARLDACALANNHLLDWGVEGMIQTLAVLRRCGVASAGAGADRAAAWAPAVLPLGARQRLLLFSWATPDSGVPTAWEARDQQAGIALLPELNTDNAEQVAGELATHIARWRTPGDRVLVSLHWGDNWGLRLAPGQQQLARQLLALGAADLVHGHSSHHPRGIEVHQGRLILYGCGDLVNDYEGIEPAPAFDASAICLYFATLERETGKLTALDVLPLALRRFSLTRASEAVQTRLFRLLQQACKPLGTHLSPPGPGPWHLQWSGA